MRTRLRKVLEALDKVHDDTLNHLRSLPALQDPVDVYISPIFKALDELPPGGTFPLATSLDSTSFFSARVSRDTSQAKDDMEPLPKGKRTSRRRGQRNADDDFSDDDERDVRWTIEQEDADDLPPLPGPGILIYKDGTNVLVNDFLGEARNELIDSLHNPERIQPVATLPNLADDCKPHPSQQKGVWQMLTACTSPVHGVLNISAMGNGKTFETLFYLEYARQIAKMKGSFNVVLTSRSCISHWVLEIEKRFAAGKRPRTFVLRDSKVSAMDLLKADVDIVITTYGFVYQQARRTKNFLRFVRAVGERGYQEALKLAREKRWPTSRPICSLYSAIFRENPFGHIVCDEVHNIRALNGKHHNAVRNLFYDRFIGLSGTPFPSRITDAFAYPDLLPNEPFQSAADIVRVFGNDPNHQYLDGLQPSRRDRLVKYFLSFTYGATNDWLRIPPCVDEIVYFRLPKDIDARIFHHVQMFLNMIAKSGGDLHQVEEDGGNVMRHAILARMLAWLPDSVDKPKNMEILEKQLEMSRVIFKGHIHKLVSAHQHNPANSDSDDELPDWTRITTRLADPGDPGLPDDLADVATFMKNHFMWLSDRGAQCQQKEVIRYLKRINVKVPAIPKKESASREAELECQVAIEDLKIIQPLANEVLNDEADTERTTRLLDIRLKNKKRLKSLPLADVMPPRVQAIIDTYKRIRHLYPHEKIIIWSQSVQLLDMVTEAFSRAENGGIDTLQFDGELDDVQRNIILDEFRNYSLPTRPLCASVGAGGSGIDLSCATQVVLCEPLWNAQDEMQTVDRSHRQPQKKEVRVYRIFGANCAIDWLIQEAKSRKWAAIEPVMEKLRRGPAVELQIPPIFPMYLAYHVYGDSYRNSNPAGYGTDQSEA